MENRMIFDDDKKEEFIRKIKESQEEFVQKMSDIFLILKGLDDDFLLKEKTVLIDFFNSALQTIREKSLKVNDQSKKIESVSRALGFDFEDYIRKTFESKYQILFQNLENGIGDGNDKDVDEETMKFITSDKDIDDYEKFLKETKIKESLNFLSKEI